MPLDDEIPGWAVRCPSGKQKFATAEDARRMMRVENRNRKKNKTFKGTPHAYRCVKCGMFHLTSAARRADGRKFNAPRPGQSDE